MTALAALLVVVLAGCGSDSALTGPSPDTACADPADCRLHEAGRIAGVRFGLAGGFSPDERTELLLAEASLKENHALSWSVIWPSRDSWNFAPADRQYDLIEAAGMHQAGFHFAWEQVFLDDLPDWVQEITDAAELRQVLDERARTIFERYPDLDRLNVINEPLSTLGPSTGLEENYFFRVLGSDYVVELFEIVDRHAPEETVLVLNENFVEYVPRKAEGLVALVAELLDAGAQLDAVGFQAHLMLTEILGREPDFDLLRRTMQRVADLGVDVWVSELDNPVDPSRPDRFAYQAENYRRVVEACLSVERCTDILVWGLEDQDTYWFPLPYDDPAPLLFDRDLERKPAYFAVREALLAGRPE